MVWESSDSDILLYEKVSSGEKMDYFLQKVVEFYQTKIEFAAAKKRERDVKPKAIAHYRNHNL